MSRSATRWSFAAVFAVALALRLVAGVWWQGRLPAGQKFGFGDSEGYWELARTMARGEAYQLSPNHRIFRTPGYPAVLAPLFLIRDEPSVLWARALSAVLGTAAVAGVAGLAWLLFDERTALVAATIAAVDPEAISLGAFVLSEAPFVPLMIVQMTCWTMAWRVRDVRNATEGVPYRGILGWALASGVAAGLATLMRPSWLLFVPFAGLVCVLFSVARRNATEGVPYRATAIAGAAMAGLCLTMMPWWIRNYQVAGRFVPTTLQVGASLYDGISPNATGASDMRFVPRFTTEQQAADAALDVASAGTFEDRLDSRSRSAAIEWARQHPARVLELAAIKFLRMWNVFPNAGEFQSRSLRLVVALSYGPLLGLALVGAWRFGMRDWPYLLCLLPSVYFTCLHVVFVSSIRYRQPALLPLMVLAAAALMHWRRKPSLRSV